MTRSQARVIFLAPCYSYVIDPEISGIFLSEGKLYRESRKDPTKKRGETPDSYSILTLGRVVQIFENIPAETNGIFEYCRCSSFLDFTLGGDMASIMGGIHF